MRALLWLPSMQDERSSGARAKHQHWVPQFYLRYFATADTRDSDTPQVWIFSKSHEDADEALTSIRNVCGKRYLYAPKQDDGERDWSLEDRLTRVEGLLGRVWPALANDYCDLGDATIRKALALFVALMHTRHPDNRGMVERVHSELVSLHEAGPKASDGTPLPSTLEIDGQTHELDPSGWIEYRDQGKDGHDRAFADSVLDHTGAMAKHLLEKRWSVIRCNVDTFITTDKPVALSHRDRERFGYGTRGTVLTFPLSPTRLLVMDDSHHEPANQYYPLRDGDAGAVNMTAWHAARRFLITGRSVPDVLHELLALEERQADK